MKKYTDFRTSIVTGLSDQLYLVTPNLEIDNPLPPKPPQSKNDETATQKIYATFQHKPCCFYYNILNLAHPDPVAKAELNTKVIIV
jgi:hypothetical protein